MFRGFSLRHSGRAFHGSLFVIPVCVPVLHFSSFRRRPESSVVCAKQNKDTGPRPAPGRRQMRVSHQFRKSQVRFASPQGSTRNPKTRTHGKHNPRNTPLPLEGSESVLPVGDCKRNAGRPDEGEPGGVRSTTRKRGTRLPPIAGSRPSASSDAASRRRQPTIAQRP